MWRVAGVMLQAIEDGPAGHVRQSDIERDRAGHEFAGQRQSGAAAQRDQRLDAALVRQVHQDAGKSDVVLHDQQDRIAGTNQVAVVVDFNIVHDGGGRGGRRRQNDIEPLGIGSLAVRPLPPLAGYRSAVVR